MVHDESSNVSWGIRKSLDMLKRSRKVKCSSEIIVYVRHIISHLVHAKRNALILIMDIHYLVIH